MKLRIYTDISVLVGCEDEKLRGDSRRLLDRFIRGDDIMVISDITLRELENAAPPVQNIFKQVPAEHLEKLALSSKATDLALVYLSPDGNRQEIDLEDPEAIARQMPVVRLVNILLLKAISDDASDILIEPFPTFIRLQFGVGGEMREVPPPPVFVYDVIVRRLKIMASMNILEIHKPQTGRIQFRHEKRDFDIEASTLPTEHGEAMALHLNNRPAVDLGAIMQSAMQNDQHAFALHVALASIHRVNFLASWDTHSYNVPIFNYVNLTHGYPKINIHTPRKIMDGGTNE